MLCHLVDTDLRTAERIRPFISDTLRIPGVPIEQLTTLLAVDARDAAKRLSISRSSAEMVRILRLLATSSIVKLFW